MLIFFCQHLLLDIFKIVKFHVLPDLVSNLWIFIDYFNPLLFSNTESFTVRFGPIAEDRPNIESTIKGTDESFVNIANDELLLFVNFESDINLTLLDKDDLVDVIKLLENYLSLLLKPWLQIYENFHHEFPVRLIVPIIVVHNLFRMFVVIWLWNPKSSPELIQEIGVQEFPIQSILSIIW